jgi:G:T-mismatch repair DNA endonuclease (very short patch repair protein)
LGWDVLIIWECETESRANVTSKVSSFLGGVQ